MGADEVELQFADLVAGNADVTEFAHAGGDGVGNLVVGNKCIDYGPRLIDSGASVRSKEDGAVRDGHFADRFESQIITVDMKGVQGNIQS